ncbi:MAG: hypothetical protein ABEH59_05520, partial [Halobacteriales archaeon]
MARLSLAVGERAGWSFDGGTLVISAEYGYSALQWWVRIALELANHRTFRQVLTPAVLDEILAEHPRAVLRGARNLGFLKDDYADGAAYAEALQDAVEHLRKLTRKRHDGEFDDRAEGASIITREALGPSGWRRCWCTSSTWPTSTWFGRSACPSAPKITTPELLDLLIELVLLRHEVLHDDHPGGSGYPRGGFKAAGSLLDEPRDMIAACPC